MIEHSLFPNHYDLITPDGKITHISSISPDKSHVTVLIEKISPLFKGYQIEPELIRFNLKSTLAQLGLNIILKTCLFDTTCQTATVELELYAIGELALSFLPLITVGAFIGKLFAPDPRRRVRDPDYLLRMFGRSDREGRPLLSLGGLQGSNLLLLEKIEGRTVAFLKLQEGVIYYDQSIFTFLPTLARALHHPHYSIRSFLHLHQKWFPEAPRTITPNQILLVKTLPLHVRTVFGKVVDEFLPTNCHHTEANILQPDTAASGDIYELFGDTAKEVTHIPLEFYTLEPYREHVFFRDRDQLQNKLEDQALLFKAFETAPTPLENRAATFIVKSDQLETLDSDQWISSATPKSEFPGLIHPHRQALLVQRYIEKQPSYVFLKAIQDEIITSQGVMFLRHFPSPLMKRDFLCEPVQRCLKGIYFQYPSQSHSFFFSHEDRSFLLDLAKFAIPVYWVDPTSGRVLQYTPKPEKDAGMFVPLEDTNTFLQATSFGIYGSCLVEGTFERELYLLLQGILEMRKTISHPQLNMQTPLALVTGGGPGVMEVGNRVAKQLGILSCANIVDFSGHSTVEQHQNQYVDVKMTYRIDRLIERQAEFNLDFPIFLVGGIGTDFEFSLEELRRKVRSTSISPILLFGDPNYWKQKITSRYQCNLESGTITGSEWVSNCLFCIQTAAQGLKIYNQFFTNSLLLGPDVPPVKEGFIIVT